MSSGTPTAVSRERLEWWLTAYERAWRTAGTEALSGLFTADATYRTAPFEAPFRGLEAIATLWEAEREGPDETFSLDSEIVAVEGDTGVVRVEAHYAGPPPCEYRDLWIVHLEASGRCRAFEEWPFSPLHRGWFAPGPEEPSEGDRGGVLRRPGALDVLKALDERRGPWPAV